MLGTKENLPRQCALCSMGKLPPKSTDCAAHFPWKKFDNTGDIHTGPAGVSCGCPSYQRHLEDYTWAAKLLLAHLAAQCWAAWSSSHFHIREQWLVCIGMKKVLFHQTSPKGTGRSWTGCDALRPIASGQPGPSSFSGSPSHSCMLSLVTG